MPINTTWVVADRLSDGIVDLINRELVEMRRTGNFDGVAILMGQLLAVLSFSTSMPAKRPPSIDRLLQAAYQCLQDLRTHASTP